MSKSQNTGKNPIYSGEIANIDVTRPPDTIDTLTIDCDIFGLSEGQLKILLIKHSEGVSKGRWALPGGWVRLDESLENAAQRLLHHFTGVGDVYLEQLRAFSTVNRVPHKRVITQGFFALVQPELYELATHGRALDVGWFDVKSVPDLIFDHNEILNFGLNYLRRKIRYEPIGVNLLPPKFTLGQLQELYEAILDKKLDKPNFRRKILRLNFLVKCNETQSKVPHRAGILYRFDEQVYQNLCQKGFSFEL